MLGSSIKLFIYNISSIIDNIEASFINSSLHMVWLFSNRYTGVIINLQDFII